MTLSFPVRCIFILLFSISLPLFASQFDNPYQGNVTVEQQSENILKQQALKQVLVKVSGNVQIVELQESKLLLRKAQSLLSQYGYKIVNNERCFSAVFDKHKINQALKDMQQPIWGDTRPTTLIWLVKDGEDNGRQLVSDNMVNTSRDADLSRVLQNQQHNRGITLQFPLMDLEDNLALSMSDIAGRFYDPIAIASMRYDVTHFIVASLKQRSTDKWSLDWQLVKHSQQNKHNEVLLSDNISGQKSLLLAAMVNQVADYYASRYAILENQGEKFSQTIYVNGINSLAKLTELNTLLANLLAISSFQFVAVEGQQITVKIMINGGLNSFHNSLAEQPNLQPDVSLSDQLHFNWH